jgi:cell division protein FtsZ
VLELITAAKGALKLAESRKAMDTIRAYASPEAQVIYGTAYDDSLGDEIRVTVVATGLSGAGAQRGTQPLKVIRTGTDNMPINMAEPVAVAPATTMGMGVGQTNYSGLEVPSVWRTNRTQAAAKVDALSSGGMDDLEIPAFLRKQAD